MNIWGQEVREELLSEAERSYLRPFASTPRPTLQEMWRLLDDVWTQMRLDEAFSAQRLAGYYAHPVWLLNGLFSASDPVSVDHRRAIARWLAQCGAQRIADYGGGFGELARCIAEASGAARVDIVEPFPSAIARDRIAGEPRIAFTDKLSGLYDAIVAQDVLEHVEDPVGLAAGISQAVKPGGFALFANAFYPYIRCHLPDTFHLRHTFRWVVAPLGLRSEGRVSGAAHALALRRLPSAPNLPGSRAREAASQLIGPVLNRLLP